MCVYIKLYDRIKRRVTRSPSMEGTTIILFISLLYMLIFSCAADTITADQTVSDGNTIISARGEFEMGFFSPKGRPQNRYFGIWYKKISTGTVIWVANRETPIVNNSGLIRVSNKGIMVGTNNSMIWSSNYSTTVKNPVAQLLDTGNLVFRDENEPENFIWQSFDYPVNNLLPGMKFGVDLARGINRYFTSWKSDDDPAPGSYFHELDVNGYPQFLLWKDSVLWFRTGPFVGSRYSGIPSLKPNDIYTSNFFMTRTQIYYISNLVNSSESPITRFVITPTGDSLRLIWNKQKQEWTVYLAAQVSDCDRYGYCGTYGFCNTYKSPRCECMKGFHPSVPDNWADADWSGGCSRTVQLNCEPGGDGFLKYAGVKLPDTRWSWYNKSMNLEECRRACLGNCNCTAYSNTDIRNGGSGCLLWLGGLIDVRGYSEDGQDLYVRLASSEINKNKNSRQSKKLKIVLVPVFAILTLLLSLFLWFAYRRRKLNRAGKVKVNARQDLDLPLFDVLQIANATDNFSFTNKLGEGGFGSVYKGMLEEGQEIAVKRLSKDSRQGVDEFMNEVSCIAKLQHRNLVRLLGCSIEEGERLLIYEYLPNKSLDSFIFDKEMRQSLNWTMRYNIINGIAKGLLYLHQDSRLRIIHRDLKASNILLDHEMNPKISDFGLARIFGESETQASTTRVVGTYGYMPPEYAIDGNFSVKSDVYSFGVLLLEIISGESNRGFDHPDTNLNLIGHVWRSYNESNLKEVVDSGMLQSSNEHQVFRAIEIGLLCVQEYPEDRPTMSSTFQMLTSYHELPSPKQPGFFSHRRKHRQTEDSSKSSTLNTITVSFVGPR
ncbi:G-type lectin S-receptor-like serine/threonine-protein kinase At4g27290 isoform X1 [Apium graveolens]|uniref:G-type lectin S-receptor-like serine/threonine-protein kinase At4g27290 isoform X1 n=2 Tax=Apium graveolens TaxID=4045 RepID=UPI003D7B1584